MVINRSADTKSIQTKGHTEGTDQKGHTEEQTLGRQTVGQTYIVVVLVYIIINYY